MAKKRRLKKIRGSALRPRVVFSESNRFIRVQAIDDSIYHTLVSLSTQNFEEEITKNSFSRKNMNFTLELASRFADKLKEKGYKEIVFDRCNKPYIGKVKAFCETMRKSGIEF